MGLLLNMTSLYQNQPKKIYNQALLLPRNALINLPWTNTLTAGASGNKASIFYEILLKKIPCALVEYIMALCQRNDKS